MAVILHIKTKPKKSTLQVINHEPWTQQLLAISNDLSQHQNRLGTKAKDTKLCLEMYGLTHQKQFG